MAEPPGLDLIARHMGDEESRQTVPPNARTAQLLDSEKVILDLKSELWIFVRNQECECVTADGIRQAFVHAFVEIPLKRNLPKGALG